MPLFDVLDAVLGFDGFTSKLGRRRTESPMQTARVFENEVGAVDAVPNRAHTQHLQRAFANLGFDATPTVQDAQVTFKDPQSLVDQAAKAQSVRSAAAARREPSQQQRGAEVEQPPRDQNDEQITDPTVRSDALLQQMLGLLEQRIGR